MEATFNPTSVTTSQWAYLAGLMDGEGYVGIHGRAARFAIEMTDEPAIRWLHSVFGGKVWPVKGTNKPAWGWNAIRKADVLLIARGILPYVIVKAARVSAAIAVLEHIDGDEFDPATHRLLLDRLRATPRLLATPSL